MSHERKRNWLETLLLNRESIAKRLKVDIATANELKRLHNRYRKAKNGIHKPFAEAYRRLSEEFFDAMQPFDTQWREEIAPYYTEFEREKDHLDRELNSKLKDNFKREFGRLSLRQLELLVQEIRGDYESKVTRAESRMNELTAAGNDRYWEDTERMRGDFNSKMTELKQNEGREAEELTAQLKTAYDEVLRNYRRNKPLIEWNFDQSVAYNIGNLQHQSFNRLTQSFIEESWTRYVEAEKRIFEAPERDPDWQQTRVQARAVLNSALAAKMVDRGITKPRPPLRIRKNSRKEQALVKELNYHFHTFKDTGYSDEERAAAYDRMNEIYDQLELRA